MDKPHKKLKAWQKAMDLCVWIYNTTEKFPRHELYGLVSQMRRSAVSIPSNIAEGAARSSERESAQFFNVARGSVSELDTHVEIAYRLSYINAEQHDQVESLIVDVDRLLYGLWKKLVQ